MTESQLAFVEKTVDTVDDLTDALSKEFYFCENKNRDMIYILVGALGKLLTFYDDEYFMDAWKCRYSYNRNKMEFLEAKAIYNTAAQLWRDVIDWLDVMDKKESEEVAND